MVVAIIKVFFQCISEVYFSNLVALWSFQWVLPPKMYFSTAAVSWTKASICSCRLRHQLQIDFITHSNPQLGIANATLMRTRNPKQVYIVFCRAVRGEPTKWFQHRQLFAETFSCSIFASQQFSDFVDQMLPVGRLPLVSVHTKKRRREVDEPETRLDLAATTSTVEKNHISSESNTRADQWPRGNVVQWHHYALWHMTLLFVHDDNWQNWRNNGNGVQLHTTERSWWDRNLQRAPTVLPNI